MRMIIEIKGDLIPVNKCLNCPFTDSVFEIEYSSAGYATAYCNPFRGIESIIGDTQDDNCVKEKLINCPIISNYIN